MRINCKNWTSVWFEFWLRSEHGHSIRQAWQVQTVYSIKKRNMFTVKPQTWQKARGSAEVQGSLTGGALYHFVREAEKPLKPKHCVNHKEWGVSLFPAFTSHTCMCLELPGSIWKLLPACWRGKGTITNTYCSSHSQANGQ